MKKHKAKLLIYLSLIACVIDLYFLSWLGEEISRSFWWHLPTMVLGFALLTLLISVAVMTLIYFQEITED